MASKLRGSRPSPGPLTCILGKARGRIVNQRVANEINQIGRAWIAQNPGGTQAQAALYATKLIQRRLALKRANYARQMQTKQNIQRLLSRRGKRSAISAMKSLFRADLSDANYLSAENMEGLRKYYEGQAHALFFRGIAELRTKGLQWSPGDHGLMKDVIREYHGQSTGNANAVAIAKSWDRTQRYLSNEATKVGSTHMEMKSYFPQPHDGRTVRGKGELADRDAWVQFVFPLLDRSKMIHFDYGTPLTDVELRGLLEEVWEQIRTGGLAQIKQRLGGSSLANRHSSSRILHFADADAWLAYNERFGGGIGNVYSELLGHMRQRSREIAAMRVLGPNPDATMEWMRQLADADTRSNQNRSTTDSDFRSIQNLYDTFLGVTSTPEHEWFARAGASVRSYLALTHLGSAFFSSLGDPTLSMLTASFNGLSRSRVFGKGLWNFIAGHGLQDRELASRLGLGMEEFTSALHVESKFTPDIAMSGQLRNANDWFMRATLLTPWTVAWRHTVGFEFTRELARMAGSTPWKALDPSLRRSMEIRQISEADWQAVSKNIGQITEQASNGDYHLSVFKLGRVVSPDLAFRFHRMLSEEINRASPTGSLSVQSATLQGTRSGTPIGEALRSIFTFKGFPASIIALHLMRGFTSEALSGYERASYLAQLMITSSLAGALVLQIKNLNNGKEPIDPFGPKAGAFWMASALQGGGAGLVGDFLFSDQDRFGRNPIESAAGPVFGLGQDALKYTLGNAQGAVLNLFNDHPKDLHFGRETVAMARRYTPFVNAWPVNLAFDRLVFDQVQMMVDDKARSSFRQTAAKQRQDFGASLWWKQGDLTP